MKIALIGGGNMGSAILGGLAKSGMDVSLFVLDPNVEKRARLASLYAVKGYESAGEWLREVDALVLAVKPQVFEAAAKALVPFLRPDVHILSIAAGVTVAAIQKWLKHEDVVRAMPNTPALVSCGITGLFASQAASRESQEIAERIMRCVGQVVWVKTEEELHIITGGSGSGPAYVFLFMEALSAALQKRGFDEALAREEALCTVEGAAKLARETGEAFGKLRENVTSKGGTTAKALEAFEAGDFRGLVDRAVAACIDRSVEMAELYK